MADEQKAIDFLTNTAKDAAKGLAEESEVYRIAENIVDDNKYLFGTVNAILNKELGISFDVGKDKEVGFMLNPEEKKAQLGFKMKFDEGGFLGKYQGGEDVVEQQIKGVLGDKQSVSQVFKNWHEANPKSQSKKDIDSVEATLKVILKKKFKGRTLAEITVKEINTVPMQTYIWNEYYKMRAGKGVQLFRAAMNVSGLENNSVEKFLISPAWKKIKPTTEGAYILVESDDAYKTKFGKAVSAIEYDMPSTMTVNGIDSIENSAKRFAKIAIHTGFRPRDIYRVTFNDIDFKNGWIRLTSEKTPGSGQFIKSVQPVSQDVLNWYAQQIKKNKDAGNALKENEKIFRITGDTEIDTDAYNGKVRAATNHIGLKREGKATGIGKSKSWTIYDFRHYHIKSASKIYNPIDVDYLTQHDAEGKWSKMLDTYAAQSGKLDMSDVGKSFDSIKNQVLEHNPKKIKVIGIKGQDLNDYNDSTRIVAHKRGRLFQGNQFTTKKGKPIKVPDELTEKIDISEFETSKDVDVEAKALPEPDIKETELLEDYIDKTEDAPKQSGTLGEQATQRKTNLKGDGTFDKSRISSKWKIAEKITKAVIPPLVGIGAYAKTKPILAALATPDPLDIPLLGYEAYKMSKKAGMGEAYDAYKLAQELQSNLFHINHINESETKGEEAQIPWKISPSLVKKRKDLELKNKDIYAQFKELGITPDQAIRQGEERLKARTEKTMEEGKTPPEHFKGMMQFYPEGYGQEQAG